MPKRKADFLPECLSRSPCPSTVLHHRQADYIELHSLVTSTPCNHCRDSGVDCLMDRSDKYSKCAACTRAGRVCKQEFHTNNEWDLLKSAEQKIAAGLSEADDELELLEPELSALQSRLAEVQQRINKTLARHARLRKQQKFLKERGFKMSKHDAELLRILDEQQSSPGQATPALDLEQLAATAENPNFDQMLAEIVDLPSSFWDGPSLSGFGASLPSAVQESVSPPGNTSVPAGGSPSSSR